MPKYFSFKELTYSETARKLGIDNTPTDETVINNIQELMDVLDGLREAWTVYSKENDFGEGGIIVNSGYRCEALNKAVGGSKTSSHKIGTAADVEPKNQHNKEFLWFTQHYFLDRQIPFDEIINEKPINNVPSWIHIGLKNREGKQRRRVFTIK